MKSVPYGPYHSKFSEKKLPKIWYGTDRYYFSEKIPTLLKT